MHSSLCTTSSAAHRVCLIRRARQHERSPRGSPQSSAPKPAPATPRAYHPPGRLEPGAPTRGTAGARSSPSTSAATCRPCRRCCRRRSRRHASWSTGCRLHRTTLWVSETGTTRADRGRQSYSCLPRRTRSAEHATPQSAPRCCRAPCTRPTARTRTGPPSPSSRNEAANCRRDPAARTSSPKKARLSARSWLESSEECSPDASNSRAGYRSRRPGRWSW